VTDKHPAHEPAGDPGRRSWPGQRRLAGGVRRRRHRRGPHRAVTLRPGRQGTPGPRCDIGVLGQGHRPTDRIEFVFRDTYQCGNEEANVGHILITTGDYQVTAEGVFTYKATADGRMAALRAYWEIDQAAASTKKIR